MFPFIVTFVGMILCIVGTVIFFHNADNMELPTEKFERFFSRFVAAWVIFVIGIAALITAFFSFLFSLVRG